MPRIRSLKPEIWSSADVLRLSVLGRLIFVILITQADDYGRMKSDAATIAASFLAGAASEAEVDEQLGVMERRKMLARYGRGEQRYLALLNWESHQKVDHPGKEAIPAPPKIRNLASPRERSAKIRAPRAHAQTRSDQTGEDRTLTPVGAPASEAEALLLESPVSLSPLEQVFEAWRARWHPTARLTDERRRKIQTRLREGWPVAELILAVTEGVAQDPWAERRSGLNDDLTHVLRTSAVVEKFVLFARVGAPGGPKRPPPESTREMTEEERERAARRGPELRAAAAALKRGSAHV